MPKQITILDPNGVEVARGSGELLPGIPFNESPELQKAKWELAVHDACMELRDLLKRENPKLGTYTVTVREVE